MASLELQPMLLGDFDAMSSIRIVKGDDDLSPPWLMRCWPLSTPENNRVRTRWAAEQQRQLFLNDTTSRYVKVVEKDREDMGPIAVARWHRYEAGFKPEEHMPLELWGTSQDGTQAEAVAHGLLAETHEVLLKEWLESRVEWVKSGPQWVLTTLKTRESQRRRGAGGMLINWGVQQAIREGAPAYLEAVPAAKSLYERFGFWEVGRQTVDLRPYGGDAVLAYSRMVANVR